MKKDKVIDIDLSNDYKEVERTISEFLNKEYKEYTFYVLANRALPSLIDGLKTGARKIMHAAFNGGLKNGGNKKLLNLSGDTMNLSLYPHGDSSLNGTIITLSQPFKFNCNPLECDGQVGSLRSPKSVSAPRYLYVKLSEFSELWKADIELTNQIFDEGQYVEPENYLPIIPTVILNRQEGMAPGYKFSTMSYNPKDVFECCIDFIKNKCKDESTNGFVLHPYIREYDNKLWKVNDDGKWVSDGKFTLDLKRDRVEITMFPYDTDFEGFEKYLNKLIEKNRIKDWKNFSEGSDIKYIIQFNKGELAKLGKRKTVNSHICNLFKLTKVVPEDLLWVLDENNKIRHFQTPQQLIEYFVKYRLNIYNDRKSRLVKILEDRYEKNSLLVKFIELVCKGKLKIRNRSKVDIKVDMDGYKLPMNLIGTPMSKCTIEERDELLKENEAIKKELDYIKKTTIQQMYLNDLEELKKKFEKEFK